MNIRRPIAWLSAAAVTTALLLPGLTAHAATTEPFQFVSLTASVNNQAVPVSNMTVVNRNVTAFVAHFNHDMDFTTTASGITFTDSTGATAPIGQNISYGGDSNQTVRGPLKAYETYTMTIKGGADGVKDAQGQTLPQDVTVKFVTGNEPLITTVHPVTSWDAHGVRQADGFVFHAAQGNLHIAMGLADGATFTVRVESAPGTPVFSGRLTPSKPEADIALPAAGDYRLILGPLVAQTPSPGRLFEVTGPDLVMPSLTVPAIQFPQMALYETKNEPFDLLGGIIGPEQAKQLQILIDGKVVRDNLLKAEPTIEAMRVDPATMTDGPHGILGLAYASDSDNMSAVVRTFFVDRVDSFTDLPRTHWARKPVEMMHDMGMITGMPDGSFAPEAAVTRSAFAKMLALTLKLPVNTSVKTSAYADVPAGYWGLPYLDALVQKGLLKGEVVDGATYMRPDRTITRAEAATIVGRVLGIADVDLATANLPAAEYQIPDIGQIPAYAKPSVLILHYRGWITGFPDGSFGPAKTLSRAQGARLLSRFLGL